MCNACFLSVPHPDVFWYRLNARYERPKKCAQKNSCNTFSIYISRKNYSLRILKNNFFFKRHKYLSLNVLNIKYFWTLNNNHWEFLGITKLSNSKLQENGMLKKRLDAVLSVISAVAFLNLFFLIIVLTTDIYNLFWIFLALYWV